MFVAEEQLLTLVANLAAKVQHKTLNGRKYLVAPATLVVPGVLNGSDGSGYYPPEENAKSARSWDGMPLVAYHPVRNGEPVAAQDPKHEEWVWNESGLGYLRNTKNSDKLVSEAWFDRELVENYDRRLPLTAKILPRLLNNQPIELSTGLHVDRDETPGTCPRTGRSYDWVARNYRPDHLAVLPDQVGACSIRDGCGVVVNEATSMATATDYVEPEAEAQAPTTSKPSPAPRSAKVKEPKMPQAAPAGSAEAASRVERQTSNSDGVGEFLGTLLYAAPKAHILHLQTKSFSAHKALDELYSELPGLVDSLVETYQGKFGVVDGYPAPVTMTPGTPVEFVSGLSDYVKSNRPAMGSDTEVQNLVDEIASLVDSTLYKLRTLTNAGKHGNPQHAETGQYLKHGSGTGKGEVHSAAVRGHQEATTTPADTGEECEADCDDGTTVKVNQTTNSTQQETDMATATKLPPTERQGLIGKIVANCKCQDADREVLNKASDAFLMRLNAMGDSVEGADDGSEVAEDENAPKKKLPPKFAKNAESKEMTDKEWLESAPPTIRRAVTNAIKVEQQARGQLISRLVANVAEESRERYTKVLVNKSLEELEMLVELLPTPTTRNSGGLDFDSEGNLDQGALFLGAAGGADPVRNRAPEGFVMNADPEMDPQYHEKKLAAKA